MEGDDTSATREPPSPIDSRPSPEVIHARGHENVRASHGSTFEVTTDDFLTPAGDCILAVEADRAPADFEPGFVAACQDSAATIAVTIAAEGLECTVSGRGDPSLTFSSDRSLVGRTSQHVDDRTVLLESGFAADGFDRDLVAVLADGADVTVTLDVTVPEVSSTTQTDETD